MITKNAANFRIIWAITSKDLLDSLRNKHLLAVIVPALFVIILYRFLPAMNANGGPARLRILAGGNPQAAATLETSRSYRPILFDNLTGLQYSLTNEEQPEIALVLPEGFDAAAAAGSVPTLQGYMLSFFTEDEISRAETALETELEALFETRVDIEIEQIPLLETSYGITVLTSLGMTFVLLVVGMVALPQLILEEKQEKTLDFILVSPANSRHIVLAKVLAGIVMTYAVFLIASWAFKVFFVHWGLLLLAGLLGTAFSVSLGLALGLLIHSRQQLALWGWVLLAPFSLPMLLVVMDNLIPAEVIDLLQWLPSVAVMRLIRTAMAETITGPFYIPQLLTLGVGTALVLAIDVWLVRRSDR